MHPIFPPTPKVELLLSDSSLIINNKAKKVKLLHYYIYSSKNISEFKKIKYFITVFH